MTKFVPVWFILSYATKSFSDPGHVTESLASACNYYLKLKNQKHFSALKHGQKFYHSLLLLILGVKNLCSIPYVETVV